jgi:hypothetical protein
MQNSAQPAKAALAGRAAAAGTLQHFNTVLDRLAPHSNARDNFVILLWKIAQNPDMLVSLSSSERTENRAISANQLKSAPGTDPLVHQQHQLQIRGTPPAAGLNHYICYRCCGMRVASSVHRMAPD